MWLAKLLAAAVVLWPHQWVSGAPNCPLQGPAFPKPTNLASHPTMQDALRNLTEIFARRDQDNSTGAYNMSYSLEVFSSSDSKPVWSWHHDAAAVEGVNQTGVRKVDPNTVYRLGSLTKVFTVYAVLLEVGDSHFNDPITKYVPELAAMAAESKAANDPVDYVDWDSVTLGSLSAQVSGIIRDYAQIGELTQSMNQSTAQALGFPPLANSSMPSCGAWPLCDRTQFFSGLKHAVPSFAPYQTAAYSDASFQILQYALESMTGRKFQDMLDNDVLKPLGMNHTFLFAPDDSQGVIPGTPNESGWSYSLGEAAPTGNMYSSVGDISAFGRAIFKAAQLSPTQVRRWLKPAFQTSETLAAVGYPWGIRRVPLPYYANGKRVTDAYSKAGSIGFYRSLLVLLPDYNVGLGGLWAGAAIPANTNWNTADAVAEVLLPAIERTAREQADAAFGGRYVADAADGLNSSIVISTQPDRPGLGVDSWVSNGTDIRTIAINLQAGYVINRGSIRLYPTLLEAAGSDGGKRVAFKAVMEDLDAPTKNSLLSTDCGTWVSQTAAVYGTLPVDQFVFSTDKDGNAVSIEPLALRVKMGRQK